MSDLRSRLNKIIDLHGQALSKTVGQREPTSAEAQLSNKDIILHFAENDPTDGKSRTQWMIQTYIQDEQFKLEDLGRATAALSAFERFKRKLPREQRELSRFKKLRDLEALVNPFVKAEAKARLERDLSTATGRELRRLEEWKARYESIILQEGDGLPTIAVPMTEFASKLWGRGTKWCTAAEKNNAFAKYHENAPLVITVCPDGAKFQMQVKPNTFQFMDNTDKTVPQHIIRKRWNEFESLFYWAVEQYGLALRHVHEEHRTAELCRLAVQQNGRALQFVPENKKTPKLCRMAVEQDGLVLYNIPQKYQDKALCRLAVRQNGRALEYVPEKHHTEELCRLAVEQDGWALKYVPKDLRTPELCRLAVERSKAAFQFIPNEKRTLELRRLAIKHGCGLSSALSMPAIPSASQRMFDKNEILELYSIAVQKDGLELLDIDEDDRTPELCQIAVEQNGLTLRCLARDLKSNCYEEKRTPTLCRIAVEQNGEALKHVPEEYKTIEICQISVKQNGLNIQYVPKEHKPKLYPLAVKQDGRVLRHHITKEDMTPELCLLAVQHHPDALVFVPEEYRTPELIASIPPIQPKWHLYILQGLGKQSQYLQDFKAQ
jgi:Domain of unknown function (DUF4116)